MSDSQKTESEVSCQTPSTTSQANDSVDEKLSLALLNIRGLRNKTHEVRHIIAHHKLHVVALCETKLNTKAKHSDMYIPGFSMWRKDKNDKSNNTGGGVALYVQDHIKTRLRPDLMKAEAEENPEAEIIWVEMELPDKPVLLGCCYRPRKDEKQYFEHIKETIKLISEKDKDKDIFLMGDFNIDWNSDEKKKVEYHLSTQAIKGNVWEQIVNVSTRVALDSETCIDHIYTNPKLCLDKKIIPTGCSDHNLVTVKVNKKIPQSKGNFRSNQFDKDKFQKDIEVSKWDKVCRLTNPKGKINSSNQLQNLKKALEEFTKIFLQVADKHAPIKSQDIYCLLKLDTTLEYFVSNRDYVKYEMIKAIYNSIKKKKKFQENIDNHLKGKPQNPPKGGNATESPFHPPLPQIEASEEKQPQQTNQISTETTDSESLPKDIAGGQRNGRNEADCLKEITFTAVKGWLEYICDHVVKVIDETEAELLKLAANKISAPIRDILKGCKKIGEFPEELKKIKSFSFSTDNYNQIRRSSGADRLHIILCYIFDVILYEQFKSFFIRDEKKSIARLKEKLEQLETDWLPPGEANRDEALLLDFTSSFDTISHDLLITKLEESDFSESDLKLIKSFLSIQEGSSGLPRGSCFAQLLRIIIINDLKKSLEPSAVMCNSYVMIYGNKSELDKKIETVNKWAKQLNISFETRRKQFKPSELPAMFNILDSMLHCHGEESNWIRAPGNVVKQNGDWKYDNISKELELHFGPDSLQRSQRQIGNFLKTQLETPVGPEVQRGEVSPLQEFLKSQSWSKVNW